MKKIINILNHVIVLQSSGVLKVRRTPDAENAFYSL